MKVPGKKHQNFNFWMKVLRREIKLHQSELSVPGQEEEAYFWLINVASEHARELIKAFKSETDPVLRWYLLKLIGDARSPEALPVFEEVIRGDEERLWSWAIYGLRDLDSREARKVLWEAKDLEKATPELTEQFREALERCSKHLVKVMREDGTWSDWFEEAR